MNRFDCHNVLRTLQRGVDYEYVQLPGSTSEKPELVFSRAGTMKLCIASGLPHGLDLAVAINRTFRF